MHTKHMVFFGYVSCLLHDLKRKGLISTAIWICSWVCGSCTRFWFCDQTLWKGYGAHQLTSSFPVFWSYFNIISKACKLQLCIFQGKEGTPSESVPSMSAPAGNATSGFKGVANQPSASEKSVYYPPSYDYYPSGELFTCFFVSKLFLFILLLCS